MTLEIAIGISVPIILITWLSIVIFNNRKKK